MTKEKTFVLKKSGDWEQELGGDGLIVDIAHYIENNLIDDDEKLKYDIEVVIRRKVTK